MCPAIEAMNSRKTFVPPGKSLMRHGKTRSIDMVPRVAYAQISMHMIIIITLLTVLFDINICTLFQLLAPSMKECGNRNSRQVCPSPYQTSTCQTTSWVQSPHFATICMRLSNHYGTMHGGHYTAFVKNVYDKKWYKFGDQYVTEMSPNGVVVRRLAPHCVELVYV